MREWLAFLVCFAAVANGWLMPSYYPVRYTQPEQVHLSYAAQDDPSQMYVTWSTMNDTKTSVVRFWLAGTQKETVASGFSRMFKNEWLTGRPQYTHTVKLTGLLPGQQYKYICGSDQGWSEVMYFNAMRNGTNWAPRFAIFGDLGNDNAVSLPWLQLEAEQGEYDAILHVGDFAYDMVTDDGRVGDQFMRQIQPIASIVPYMTCPGNHEINFNFSNYKGRFAMPGDEIMEKMFYSFNIGPVHVISFSSEYYFAIEYGIIQPVEQFRWLEKDLANANKPENRAKQPWIITMAHRPMYCSNNDLDDCTRHESIVRTGVSFLHALGLEDLFYRYGVDVQLWAHEHSYERLWPVYNRKVYNGSASEPYTNPGAPVHIITGSAGCREKHDNFKNSTEAWSAFRSDDYGYTRMTVFNATHMYMEQVSVEQDEGTPPQVVDKLWLKKDTHSYPKRDAGADSQEESVSSSKKEELRRRLSAKKGKYQHGLDRLSNQNHVITMNQGEADNLP